MTIFKVTCGTYRPETFEVDLDKYGIAIQTDADDVDRNHAFALLQKTMNDETFADDHCRNEDAVNGCIALHVLGYNPAVWFDNFCEEQKLIAERWFACDLVAFMKHVERVVPYLSKWGPRGNESQALEYTI